jgi:hypothetical protein
VMENQVSFGVGQSSPSVWSDQEQETSGRDMGAEGHDGANSWQAKPPV